MINFSPCYFVYAVVSLCNLFLLFYMVNQSTFLVFYFEILFLFSCIFIKRKYRHFVANETCNISICWLLFLFYYRNQITQQFEDIVDDVHQLLWYDFPSNMQNWLPIVVNIGQEHVYLDG